jgi:hypothetical protein
MAQLLRVPLCCDITGNSASAKKIMPQRSNFLSQLAVMQQKRAAEGLSRSP